MPSVVVRKIRAADGRMPMNTSHVDSWHCVHWQFHGFKNGKHMIIVRPEIDPEEAIKTEIVAIEKMQRLFDKSEFQWHFVQTFKGSRK